MEAFRCPTRLPELKAGKRSRPVLCQVLNWFADRTLPTEPDLDFFKIFLKNHLLRIFIFGKETSTEVRSEIVTNIRSHSQAHSQLDAFIHLRLPGAMRVCHMCHSGAICDERHVPTECSGLLDLRVAFSPLIAEASGIMARLVWADDQPLVSKHIIACLNQAESHGVVWTRHSLTHQPWWLRA